MKCPGQTDGVLGLRGDTSTLLSALDTGSQVSNRRLMHNCIQTGLADIKAVSGVALFTH